MANKELNNNLPSPENSGGEFSIEIKNSDKIYNTLRDREYRQKVGIKDNQTSIFLYSGDIYDNLIRCIHFHIDCL